jgi:trk system potassium uptake protein TrkA
MHVVVVGCGRVGSGLADDSSRPLVTRSQWSTAPSERSIACRQASRAPRSWAPGSTATALDAAGAKDASALASVTNGDNSNILCARIARETYGIVNVVARIYDPRRAVIYQRLGIPTVATVTWTTTQVLRWLLPDDTSVEWRDDTGSLLLVERILPDHWAGHHLSRSRNPVASGSPLSSATTSLASTSARSSAKRTTSCTSRSSAMPWVLSTSDLRARP